MKALATLFIALAAHAAEPLPALHAARDGITVSGVSSGGYMAVQLHVAHSARVAGVGVIAGGPYYCAQGSLFKALYNCMQPGRWTPVTAPALLKSEADALAAARAIDATANLARSRAWLFSGTADHTVYPAVVQALRDFYAAYKAPVVLVADKPAGHGMVTDSHGNACDVTDPPFIVDCDYDAAGQLLAHLLGSLQRPASKEHGRLLAFDQTRYADGDAAAIAMDDVGFVYVPQRCATEQCRIHVAFHGCRQGAAEVGERFVREAGYNRWADANALIVLYPQVVKRYSPLVFNPRGCWDWWGYTGAQYHTKAAPQMRAVMKMVDRLAE
ncbi:MAG TPA: depolymerase [Burkholderiales bacterium]|nr:depolymerase [Burkholderiales bacterium]